jgi:hypothetical protein
MTTQQQPTIANANSSEAINSEIRSITSQTHDLGRDVDAWNMGMLWALIFAALAAVTVVVTTRMVIVKSGQLGEKQTLLAAAKDRQLQLDLAEKRGQIEALRVEADTAQAGIATAHAEAAKANLLAEQEKLARVELKKQVAPRTLSLSERQELGAKLQKFAKNLSGRKVAVSSYSGDAEGIVFSLEVVDVLTRAGIEIDPVIGRLIPVGMVDLGVKVTGPTADKDFLVALGNGINDHGTTAVRIEWDDKYPGITVSVGSKPVSGFPDVSSTPAPK